MRFHLMVIWLQMPNVWSAQIIPVTMKFKCVNARNAYVTAWIWNETEQNWSPTAYSQAQSTVVFSTKFSLS